MLLKLGNFPLYGKYLPAMLVLALTQLCAELVVPHKQDKTDDGTSDQDYEEDDDQLDHGLRGPWKC